MTVRLGAIGTSLADARGSDPSHDRKGVVSTQGHYITRSEP